MVVNDEQSCTIGNILRQRDVSWTINWSETCEIDSTFWTLPSFQHLSTKRILPISSKSSFSFPNTLHPTFSLRKLESSKNLPIIQFDHLLVYLAFHTEVWWVAILHTVELLGLRCTTVHQWECEWPFWFCFINQHEVFEITGLFGFCWLERWQNSIECTFERNVSRLKLFT